MKRKYQARIILDNDNGDVFATHTLEFEYKNDGIMTEKEFSKIDDAYFGLLIPYINRIIEIKKDNKIDRIVMIKTVFNDDGTIIERNNTYFYKWDK